MTYLSNDDSNIYFILYDTVKIKRKLTSKICVYNLKTEASKIIYSSDTLLFISLFQSNEGNCVIFVSLDKHGITYINYLNLLNDKNSIIFHSHHVISNAIISSKQDIIYFTANKYLTEKKYDFNQKIAGNQSIYSINLDGKNLTKLSTFYYLFNSTMYLDKSNENIYFNLESDSVMGPFMLNLTTKKLTSLASTISLNQIKYFSHYHSNEALKVFLIPIPALLDSVCYLYTPGEIYKDNFRSQNCQIIYRQPNKETHKYHYIYNPILFNHSNSIIMLKDTGKHERYFVILNEKGKIEKMFRPSIAKFE